MELSIHPIIIYCASWFVSMAGVWALFERAETVASTEVKVAISNWLRNIDIAGAEQWPSMFARMFDRVFGKRHLSFRCFFRSAFVSLTSVVLLTLIWIATHPDRVKEIFVDPGPGVFIAFGFVGLCLNLFPDYLSLLKSRIIIHYMGFRSSNVRIVMLLITDFLATGFIVVMAVTALVFIFVTWGQEPEFLWSDIWNVVIGGFGFSRSEFSVYGVFFYSTYFTSLWVWLYALSGFLLKLTRYFGVTINMLKKFLDIDNKPIRSIGFVSMLLVTVVYIILPFVR